jgi:hypothetical protein
MAKKCSNQPISISIYIAAKWKVIGLVASEPLILLHSVIGMQIWFERLGKQQHLKLGQPACTVLLLPVWL